MVKIYISPSNQPTNDYCVGGTNEKAQMEAIALKIKGILDAEYDCQSVMATLSSDINERATEAKNNNCNVYLAIHSNAGSSSASGAVAFYHPSSQQSKTFASNIVKELNAACPVKSNRSVSVANGMEVFNGSGYGEIRMPSQNGLTATLAETDFHDNPKTAEWIINNKDAIARAYVNAIVATFGVAKKSTSAPVATGKLYRVQLGAFSVKANAEAQLNKAKAAGFKDAYIKYE